MPRVLFIEHDGTPHACDVPTGTTAMRAAVDNGVPGIDGDCGGECACGTCHVFVAPEWVPRVGPAAGREADMLSFAEGSGERSRLGCQVRIEDHLDGLVLHLPAGQH